MSEGYTPSRKATAVGAIQWAAVGYAIAAAVNGAIVDYYWFVRDAETGIPTPLEVLSAAAFPVLILGGLLGGVVWVRRRTDSAARERHDHRLRVAFLFVLFGFGVLALVAEAAASRLLGDRLYAVPYFLVPSVLDLLGPFVAYALVYVASVDWTEAGGRTTDGAYRPSVLVGVVGGVQWAVTALYLTFVAFGVAVEYLDRTRESYSLDFGGALVVGVSVAFVAGYLWARRSADSAETVRLAHRQRVEYVLSVFAFGTVLSILTGLSVAALPLFAFDRPVFLLGGVFAFSLLFAALSTYVADVRLLDRLLSS